MQTTTSLLSLLENLLPVCPAPYEADVRSMIESLKGFEIIFAEGLDDEHTVPALFDVVEQASLVFDGIATDLDDLALAATCA